MESILGKVKCDYWNSILAMSCIVSSISSAAIGIDLFVCSRRMVFFLVLSHSVPSMHQERYPDEVLSSVVGSHDSDSLTYLGPKGQEASVLLPELVLAQHVVGHEERASTDEQEEALEGGTVLTQQQKGGMDDQVTENGQVDGHGVDDVAPVIPCLVGYRFEDVDHAENQWNGWKKEHPELPHLKQFGVSPVPQIHHGQHVENVADEEGACSGCEPRSGVPGVFQEVVTDGSKHQSDDHLEDGGLPSVGEEDDDHDEHGEALEPGDIIGALADVLAVVAALLDGQHVANDVAYASGPEQDVPDDRNWSSTHVASLFSLQSEEMEPGFYEERVSGKKARTFFCIKACHFSSFQPFPQSLT